MASELAVPAAAAGDGCYAHCKLASARTRLLPAAGPPPLERALRVLGVAVAAIAIWDPRFFFSASLGRVLSAAAAAAAASPLGPVTAAAAAALRRGCEVAAAAVGSLMRASPLAGIVLAALACVGLAVAGLLAAWAAGQLRRRSAFTLLMQPQETSGAEAELADLEPVCH